MSLRAGQTAALLLALSLAGCARFPPLSPRVEALPQRLSETGLYADAKLVELAPDARPYSPRFELWSDGSAKRRWIRLPPNKPIVTTDMDQWDFPVGTELWKEFSYGGTRIETRLLTRVATDSDGWVAVAYLWNAEHTEAFASPDGLDDALETTHDVPSSPACMTCHGGRNHRVLGFSAIQLSHDPSSASDLTIDQLAAEGLITRTPTAPLVIPGNPAEIAALGYLHTNCGSCHNGNRPADARYLAPPPELDLWLRTTELTTVSSTRTYRTAIPEWVTPGQPTDSDLLDRVSDPDWFWEQMPPVGTEVVDVSGSQILSRWIAGLPH